MGRQKLPRTITREQQMLEMLNTEPATAVEIHQRLGVPYSTVKSLLWRMADKGTLTCLRRGVTRPLWMTWKLHARLVPGSAPPALRGTTPVVQGVSHAARFLPAPVVEPPHAGQPRITRQAAPAGRFEVRDLPPGGGVISQDWARRRAGQPVESRVTWLR